MTKQTCASTGTILGELPDDHEAARQSAVDPSVAHSRSGTIPFADITVSNVDIVLKEVFSVWRVIPFPGLDDVRPIEGVRLGVEGMLYVDGRVFPPGTPVKQAFCFGTVERRAGSPHVIVRLENGETVFFHYEKNWCRLYLSSVPVRDPHAWKTPVSYATAIALFVCGVLSPIFLPFAVLFLIATWMEHLAKDVRQIQSAIRNRLRLGMAARTCSNPSRASSRVFCRSASK